MNNDRSKPNIAVGKLCGILKLYNVGREGGFYFRCDLTKSQLITIYYIGMYNLTIFIG